MDFAEKTLENLKADLMTGDDWDDAVFYSSIFVDLDEVNQMTWCEKMKKKYEDTKTKETASLYEKMKAYVVWQHYENLYVYANGTR